MELKLFRTLWGAPGTIDQICEEAVAAGFQGIEGPVPAAAGERDALAKALDRNGLDFIAEITTAGGYVPNRQASVAEHLQSLALAMERSIELHPRFITCLGGCDAWTEADQHRFVDSALGSAARRGVTLSLETHRSRILCNPWSTTRLLDRFPELMVTCDFSHWCVVGERILDDVLDGVCRVAQQAHHIHGRVGYEQGPQVPHPAAPEYRYAVEAHQRWWERIWESQRRRRFPVTTMTPEFGPDGYLQCLPFSQQTVADLWEINRWLATTERRHFASWQSAT